MFSCGSNAGMETSTPLMSNALFHSNSHINQTLPQIILILRFCPVDYVAPDFVINWVEELEVRAVRWPQIWKFARVRT